VVDALAGYHALKDSVAALPVERDFLAVTGLDAESYLQGQLSQDVAGMAEGSSRWSLILAPAGRVDALVRVTRREDGFLIDVDGGWGEAVAARLVRFKLRTKLEVTRLGWRVVALRGPAAATLPAPGGAEAVLDASWPGLAGVDLAGVNPAVAAGMEQAGPGAYQAARVEAGVPVMGAELTERTIPAEAGVVAATVSFTKGCYTGQELVARIDSRGSHVARHLRGLLLADHVAEGTPLEAAGKQVGSVTSVARSPRRGWVALGYVGRAVEPGAEIGAGGTAARVVTVPMDEGR
jgi:folate-binding protein YgfZ